MTVKEDDIDPMHSMGFQSNWGPYSTYSGSMMYDFTRNSIYVTGLTYETNTFADTPPQTTPMPQSSCFVGHIPLADIQVGWKLLSPPLPPSSAIFKGRDVDPNFVIPDSLKEDEQLACSTILYDSTQSQKAGGDYLYVGGVDEKKMDARDDGTISSFVNVYDRTSNSPDWTNTQIVSTEFPNPSAAVEGTASADPLIPVRYPIGMVHGYDTNLEFVQIAVLSVSSQDPLFTDAFIENDDRSNPRNYKNSLLPPGIGANGKAKDVDYYKRGSNFYPSFQTFQIDGDAKSRSVVFTSGEDFQSTDPTNKKYNNIFPTGITNLLAQGDGRGRQHYVFVGSYRGTGCAAFGSSPEATNSTDHDYDGFAAARFGKSVEPAIRFHSMQTEPNLHDYVHGVCTHPGEAGDDLSYYVVGSTYGTMPKGTNQTDLNVNKLGTILDNDTNILSSWISKVDAATQTVLWTTQVYSTKHNEAFGCHVIPSDPSTMYVGGTVYNNGSMMYVRSGTENKIRKSTYHIGGGKSAGKDDVWVAQLNTDDGALKWMKQLGSTGDDHISRTNGVQADVVGDCIIYGDTNGELYRSRFKDPRQTDGNPSTRTDIFVVKLDKRNGNYVSTIEMDRVAFSKSHKKVGGLVVGILFILLCLGMFALYYIKFYRPKRRTSNNINGLDNEGLFTDGVLTSYRDQDACDPDVDDIIEAHNGHYHDDAPTANGVAVANGNGRPNPVASTYSDDVPPSEDSQNAKVDINGNDNNSNNDSSQKSDMDQTAFKDDPDYRPGRNFV
mmetsp:Transcript_43046/g.48769  ORF Transcript_43046/g.48769 Transcript_43046/m.48769 type:complete len:776 (-) Transcript_43046:307-2634(-)